MTSTLQAAFDEPAFLPYLAAGDPSIAASRQYVEALVEGGADAVELGLPFSEPIAEGKTIQDAIVRSLQGGMTPRRYFEFVESLGVDVPIVCMTYYNLVYQFGDERGPAPFVRRAAAAGIDGFVIPDLPAEEAGPLRTACDETGLDLISIVAPTTSDHRLERLMALTSGYVYVQARLGVTGAREDVSDRTAASLDRLAGYDVPKAVGFGIKTGDHAKRVIAAGADGVIVGSTLVDIVAEGYDAAGNGDDPDTDAIAATADRLREKAAALKRGALAGVRGSQREGATDRPRPDRADADSRSTPRSDTETGPERT